MKIAVQDPLHQLHFDDAGYRAHGRGDARRYRIAVRQRDLDLALPAFLDQHEAHLPLAFDGQLRGERAERAGVAQENAQ